MNEQVVCIFPHSNDEFASEAELRAFLSDWLSRNENEGRYLLGKLGRRDKDLKSRVVSGSLVLFRKGKHVVSEAEVRSTFRELSPPERSKTEHGVPKDYYHEITFDPATVRVYSKGISVEEIEVWTGRRLDPRFYSIIGSRTDFERAFQRR